MLFAVELLSKDMVIVGLIATTVASLAGWLLRKDTKIEQRRAIAVDLVADLSELGLERLSGFAKAYATGDYSGILADAKILAREISKPGGALGLLAESFFKQLPKRLADDGDRQKIEKLVADFRTANPQVVVAKQAVVGDSNGEK